MFKLLPLSLLIIITLSCLSAKEREYKREYERKYIEFRNEQLKGVKMPPETVIDCWNILVASSGKRIIHGKIVQGENKKFAVDFSLEDIFEGDLRIQQGNMATCNFSYIALDPHCEMFATVVMLLSSDKKIYAITCTYDEWNDNPVYNYFLYKDGDFVEVEFKSLPLELKERAGKIQWPLGMKNYY